MLQMKLITGVSHQNRTLLIINVLLMKECDKVSQ